MSHRPARRFLIVLLAAALGVALLAGCSSGDDDTVRETATTTDGPSAPSAGDSAADGAGDGAGDGDGDESSCPDEAAVAAAVGAAITLSPSSNVSDGCNYYGEDGSPDAEVSVNVLVEQPATRTIEDIERNMSVDRVEGVGDAAWEAVTPGGIVQFGVFEGDRYVTVTISGASDDPTMGRAVYDLLP